jgi:tRNA (guanine37-N1)-methyltransferase
MITFHIVSIFPEVFSDYFNTSIIKRAQQKGLVKIKIHNLRDFTSDKHRTVDDRPYGGGPGMIMRADVIHRALLELKRQNSKGKTKFQNLKVILLSPAGKQFDQKMAQKFSKLKEVILICGRYEGIDARVEKFVNEKISVGPYVLSGGELPAMTMVEAITRLVPGVIKKESLLEETHNKDFIEYKQYTRPEVLTIREKNARIKVLKVPKILLSGHHQKIKNWREKNN